ncbi:MAG: hypothetical protein ACHREM_23080 [Polyangiales bacterium]
MNLRSLRSFALIAPLFACSSSTTSTPGAADGGTDTSPIADTGATADTGSTGDSCAGSDVAFTVDAGPEAGCTGPCDHGNALGVGMYCNGFADCSGNSTARLCASLGDPTLHFCTFLCTKPDAGGANPCGEGATCQCGSGSGGSGCGCTPNACL